jgi:TRAP-type C4-dicarboxylate transport system permease small subunit
MRWIFRNVEILVSSIAFTVMVTVVVVNVLSRYFLGKSFSFTEEIAFMGFTYCLFFGASLLYKNHALIAIDVIVDRMPRKLQRFVKIFNFALLTFVNAVLVYLSTVLSLEAWIRPTAALRIPYTFIDMSATIAFALMTLYSIRFLINAVRSIEDKVESMDHL